MTGDDSDPTLDAPQWRQRKPRAGAGAAFLSPAVRRLVAERNVDPSQLAGTGHAGRVTRANVLAAPDGDALRAESDTVIPFSRLRRTAARRLVESKTTAAHAHVMVECDYTRVDRARGGARLTYLPFVVRAVIDALREFPECNATVAGSEVTRHEHVHLGIAVDLDHEELVVPVVHDADALRLRALADEIAAAARRARDGQLRPDDVTGGTFTITNPGPFGTIVSVPVINFPQVAIFATDAVRHRPVVVSGADGADVIGIHPVGTLSLGFDHRAVDLFNAAAFVARTRDIIEQRDWVTEL